MKTRNNTKEKVNGQVTKMVFRGSAIVFSLLLISLTLTVTAQNFWKQFLTSNAYNKMALLMVEQPSEFGKADAAIDAINAELEAHTNTSAKTFVVETDVDEEFAVEAWMTDETYFNVRASQISDETDETLNLEEWMINNANFNSQVVSIPVDAEPALEVEDWMTAKNFFNTTEELTARDANLKIEDWMLKNKYFSNRTSL